MLFTYQLSLKSTQSIVTRVVCVSVKGKIPRQELSLITAAIYEQDLNLVPNSPLYRAVIPMGKDKM